MLKQVDSDHIYSLMRTTNSIQLALIGMEAIRGRTAHAGPPLGEDAAYRDLLDDLSTLTAELRDGVVALYGK